MSPDQWNRVLFGGNYSVRSLLTLKARPDSFHRYQQQKTQAVKDFFCFSIKILSISRIVENVSSCFSPVGYVKSY